jgi:ABC-2 type transport system ATP-binding protein
MSFAIKTVDLTKKFGEHTAVERLNLEVEPGSVVGLIGPNGAGKTTALRMLLDIIKPTSGKARVLGQAPQHGGPALRRRIGFIPGELRLDGRVTGANLLKFFAGISGEVPAGAIETLAERFAVDLSRPVRALSKGNRQKVGLIQAFMHSPELLILDEPTSGLDPLMQREFLQLLRECREQGQTVLLSSHVLSEIQQAADTVWVLSAGEIVASGAVDALRLSTVRRMSLRVEAHHHAALGAHLAGLGSVTDVVVHPVADAKIRIEAIIRDGVDAVIKTLAQYPILELTLEEPDLEESVLRLYGDQRRPHE